MDRRGAGLLLVAYPVDVGVEKQHVICKAGSLESRTASGQVLLQTSRFNLGRDLGVERPDHVDDLGL